MGYVVIVSHKFIIRATRTSMSVTFDVKLLTLRNHKKCIVVAVRRQKLKKNAFTKPLHGNL